MTRKKLKAGLSITFQYAGIIVCLCLAVASLWLGEILFTRRVRHRTQQNITSRIPMPDVAHRGVWDWRSPDSIPETTLTNDFTFLAQHGVNTVYVDLSRYIDYYEESDAAQKLKRLTNFHESLKRYVAIAHQHHISVHALAGDTSWGLASHAYIPKRYVEFVHAYNQSAAEHERLAGLQFDIEVHNHDTFAQNKKQVLAEYLLSIRDVIAQYQAQKSTFMLGYTMPYWFDNENENLPLVTYSQKSAPVAYHMFDMLNAVNGGYAVIMDYRTAVDGSDGSVAHARHEMVYTAKHTPQVKIVVAQETTEVVPAKITFYNKESRDLLDAIQRLSATFAPHETFYGIAVHDLEGYRRLFEKPPKNP